MAHYDLILVGSGFASSFFLHEYLRQAPRSARVLVLECGQSRPHQWHIANVKGLMQESLRAIHNATQEKPWHFALTFGGTSNWWWACTPRMLPEDFELRTRFGHGVDWPLAYNDLEPSYAQAEAMMAVSGPADHPPGLLPRSRPYPQPPHRLNDPDRLFKKGFPDLFFAMPSARLRLGLGGRPPCCASGICTRCPVDAKFTVLNGLQTSYVDSRVTVRLGARAERVEVAGGTVAEGVNYRIGEREELARGDIIALGANAIFNPFLLLKSGLDDGVVGRGLMEQRSISVDVHLDGVDNFQGSTSLTGHGYMLYAGERRRHNAAGLMETSNVPRLRMSRGKWRQVARLKFIFEDLGIPENQVRLDPENHDRPVVVYRGMSDYTRAGIERLDSELPRVLAPLPVEEYKIARQANTTEGHVLGTTPMGDDPATSVIDRNLTHHKVRNLLVLGGGAFPTASPANPTLTLSALSLRAARQLGAVG